MRFATLRAAARTDFLTAFFAVFLAAFLAGFCAAFFADFVAAFFADLFAAARLGCAFVPAVFFVFLAPTTFLAAAARDAFVFFFADAARVVFLVAFFLAIPAPSAVPVRERALRMRTSRMIGPLGPGLDRNGG
ncbi:MAG: hypothetical protein ACYTGY_19540, partial [Planctomycetota bacterium]